MAVPTATPFTGKINFPAYVFLPTKAVRVIQEADSIFAASSSKNDYSLAVEIAKPHIAKLANIIFLSFPMTRDKKIMQKAWDKNARQIADVLKQGLHIAFLTLGDPLTYSTFGYVLKSLNTIMPHAGIETIPGITSFHAASARLNRTLVEAEESLLITSGAYGGEQLRNCPQSVQNIVMMKAYKNVGDINYEDWGGVNLWKDTSRYIRVMVKGKPRQPSGLPSRHWVTGKKYLLVSF